MARVVGSRPVLIGWELGGNLGHLMPLAVVVRQLIDHDVPIIAAVRELLPAATAFKELQLPVLPAPGWPRHRHMGNEDGQRSYGDLLTLVGFGDPAKLHAVVAAWIAIIDLVKPTAILCDHSPGLQIAARARAIAVVNIGTPTLMPPLDGDHLPPIVAYHSPFLPEARLLASAASVLQKYRKQAPSSLPELLKSEFRLVFGLPELDPYANTRRELLYSPLEGLPVFKEISQQPGLFVYLRPDLKHAENFFQALVETGFPAKLYLPDCNPALSRFLRASGLHVFEQPPLLSEVLPSVTHVISAGGAITTQAAMAAGRPQLMFPGHSETRMNSVLAARLGISRSAELHGDRESMRVAILDFVRDAKILLAARDLALKIAARKTLNGLPVILAALQRYA